MGFMDAIPHNCREILMRMVVRAFIYDNIHLLVSFPLYDMKYTIINLNATAKTFLKVCLMISGSMRSCKDVHIKPTRMQSPQL